MNSSSPKISCRNPIFIEFLQNMIKAGTKFCFKDGTEITDLNFKDEQLYIGEISANSFFKEREHQKTIRWLDHLYYESGGKPILVKNLLVPHEKKIKEKRNSNLTLR
jgi:hypothetical protein